MHSPIFVINYTGHIQKYDENELFELFGEHTVDYVSSLPPQQTQEEIEWLMSAFIHIGIQVEGTSKSFRLSDANISYAKHVLPKFRQYVMNLTIEEFAKSYSYVSTQNAFMPYRHVLIVDPDGCPTNLDKFLTSWDANEANKKLCVSDAFDYHW